MSYFLNIYECEHDIINRTIVSKEDCVIQASTSSIQVDNLNKLYSKSYTRDPETLESDDAIELLEAFEFICKQKNKGAETVELYLNDDYPIMEEFIFNDWDVNNDFGLPLSPNGTPAVIYRNSSSLNSFLSTFKEMIENEDYDEDFIAEDELNKLNSMINHAIKSRNGLFIFCHQ
ncbi:hypothetical protein [Litorilituus sediminis]|uniref:Uncharacterized protein n=1 Tax=Litorilituus sediminis TaxID=718192 RepID=A0A4P6P1E8_9GAMM|nr:hypothetical protein [Litorilituus sediminis]QBG34931.1 hypothetical protein EMK97_03875 [Litorilituus sediminis]